MIVAADPVETLVGHRGGSRAGTSADDTPSAPAHVEREGDDIRFLWPAESVVVGVTAARDSSSGLHAEISIRHAGRDVHWGHLALASTTAREQLVKKLQAVAGVIPWRPMLEEVCRTTAYLVRQGEPVVELRGGSTSSRADQRYLVEKLLPLGETTTLFGDGGSGKGYLAVATSIAGSVVGITLPGGLRAQRATKTLYLDYESRREELDERLALLSAGLGIRAEGIYYRPMTRALADEAARVRTEIARLGIGLVIVDSFAPACGVEPDGTDSAVRLMNALRSFAPATRLLIAHVSKAHAEQRAGATRPFGSVFVWNLSRSVWEVRRDAAEETDLAIGLYHRKANQGRLHAPLGFRFVFGADKVSVEGGDLSASADLLGRMTLQQRIRTALAPGALTAEHLAEQIEATEESVSRVLRRLRAKGQVVRLEDGKWGLSA